MADQCWQEHRCGACGTSWDEAAVRRLEDAVLALWAELPVEQVKILRDEASRLVEFIVHLHHSVEHEQAMVRSNVWSEEADRG